MNQGKDFRLFGGRELRIVGQTITAITLDSNIVIFAGHGARNSRDYELRIETDIQFRSITMAKSITIRYEPYSNRVRKTLNLGRLTDTITKRVTHARAFMSGVLELQLDQDIELTIMPLTYREAWTFSHSDYILSCPPGGFEA